MRKNIVSPLSYTVYFCRTGTVHIPTTAQVHRLISTMSSFKRFEVRQRAMKRWKVVKSAVFGDKFERARRRKRGNHEWLEEWNERKKTAAACERRELADLLLKVTLYFRDFREEFKSLCELYVASEMSSSSSSGLVRRLKKQHLYAIFANSTLEPTRQEARKIIEHVLALEPKPGKFTKKTGGSKQQEDELKKVKQALLDNNDETSAHVEQNSNNDAAVVVEKTLTEYEFIFLVNSWLRLRGHRDSKAKEQEALDNKDNQGPKGSWVGSKSPRTGKERFVWRRNADAGKLKRQKAKGGAKEGAAEEVMDKIRKMANKRKGMDLKAAFVKFDINNDGTIEPHELDMVLRSLGIELESFELDAVFNRFDPDGGGSIDYAEFSYTFYNRRAIAKASMTGSKILPGAAGSGDGVETSIDQERGSKSTPNLHGGSSELNEEDATLKTSMSNSLMPTVKLATSSEMMVSKILRALTIKGAPLETMDSARREEYADRAIRKIAEASMKKKRFDLKGAFEKFDLDGNGTVDKVEFVSIMQGFDPGVSEMEALAAFDRFDPSGDGAIDFEEFSFTFYNRRTFSESTKKIKKRRALGVTQRRKAAEKQTELLHRIENYFNTPECRSVFSEFADRSTQTLDLAGLNASMSQLNLDLNKDEVSLILNTLNEGLHHAVTYDEFKNIVKLRRRNMSACRQSIDENKGAHRKLPLCTTFRAPVLKEDDSSTMATVRAAQLARTRGKLTPMKEVPSIREQRGKTDEMDSDVEDVQSNNIVQLPPLEVSQAREKADQDQARDDAIKAALAE